LKETPELHSWKEVWMVGVTLHSNRPKVGSENPLEEKEKLTA
jgi:hypothetical protein